MIKSLSVQNYALIENLEISFDTGLSVITGETGAGKSILLGALDLILGKRADHRSLLSKDKKCIVEGTFNINSYSLDEIFERFDLDHESITTVRREINNQGKSRAFINDTPVKLDVLREIAGRLVDIHSQHQNLAIFDSDFQTATIDSYASIADEVQKYRKDFRHLNDLKNRLKALREKDASSRKERDYLNYLLKELYEVNIKPGEQKQLEEELRTLEHAEEIKSTLYKVQGLLDNENTGLLQGLREVKHNIAGLKQLNKTLEELSARLESNVIELSDIHQEIERTADQIIHSPDRLQEVRGRLDTVYELQHKHGVNSEEGLIGVISEIEEKLGKIKGLESELAATSGSIESLTEDLKRMAVSISEKRKGSFPTFQAAVVNLLKDLGMDKAQFVIGYQKLDEPGMNGYDQMKFLFNANRGGEAEDIALIASGGEKSRLMLAVKSTLSRKTLLPTIIFDEIDSGVSGRVAEKVGLILQKLAEKMQVLVITHLPQIAGKGKSHFLVYKENSGDKTRTAMKKLDDDARLVEIAKLLSGREITNASLESAKHLLDN